MSSALSPERGVPDALAEWLQHEAVTRYEELAGRLLRAHRDCLNGGFHQTLFNLYAIGENPSDYISAYERLGLPAVSELVGEAFNAWFSAATESDQVWDDLDDRYARWTYGTSGNDPDAIEAALISFIQQHPAEFENALRLTAE